LCRKIIISRILILFLIFPKPFQLFLFSQETIPLLEEGERLFQSGDYRKSLTFWLQALQSNPNSSKALLGYAKTSLMLNSISDAEMSYRKVLSLNPDSTEAISGIGTVLSLKGMYPEARKYLEENLRKFPNDSHILFALANVYQDSGKTELAVYKLEKARKYGKSDLELLDRLGRMYIQQNKLTQAQDIAREITTLYPDSFYGNRMNGMIFSISAYRQPISSPDSEKFFNLAKKSFESVLLSNPREEETLYWLGKLYVWRGEEKRDEALGIFRNLMSMYPEKENYYHLTANLLSEKKIQSPEDKKNLEEYFSKLLQMNDLDEITRFQAEEFSIRFLSPESPFRKRLGIYRFERYSTERNSLHYESSLYHLYRARDLLPGHHAIREALTETYKDTGNLNEFISMLQSRLREDPGNFKLQNRLEQAILLSKKTLEYREGFFYPTVDGMKFEERTTIPKIYLHDFVPDEEMSDKILSPSILRLAILHALKHTPGIHLATEEESEQIQSLIRSQKLISYNPYHNSTYFDINATPAYPKLVRFVGIGRFKEHSRSLQIEFQIYDRKTGKFSDTIKLHAGGRSSLANLSCNLSRKIKDFIPKEGNILKIKREGVIVNLGTRNGITKDTLIQFRKGNKVLMDGKIDTLGTTISLVKPNSIYWEKELATGDSLIAVNN